MTTGMTVGTSTSATPLKFPGNVHGPYYDSTSGLWWMFWFDGTNLVYSSCATLTGAWAAKATVTGSATYSAVEYDGTYFHIGYTPTGALYYRQCTPNSNGILTIGAQRTLPGGNIANGNPITVCVTTDGHVCISYIGFSDNYAHAIKNNNAASSDAWSTAAGFPVSLEAVAGYNLIIRQGPSGSIVGVYGGVNACRWNSVASDGTVGAPAAVTLTDTKNNDCRDLVTVGSTYYLIYLDTNNHIKFRIYSGGAWGLAETDLATVAGAYPTLQYYSASGDLYALWISASNTIVYDKFSGGSWGGATTWLDESGDGTVTQSELNAPNLAQSNNMVVGYKTAAASPYNVKVAGKGLVPVAVVWISDTDQNSDVAAAWDVGQAPGAATTITLSASHVGKCTINQAVAFGNLTVPAGAGALEIAASCSVPSISNAADILIDSAKVLTVLRQGANTFVNTGTVRGPGTLSLMHKDADLITYLGKVSCALTLDLDAAAGASHTATLGLDGITALTVQSSHAADTLTLDVLGHMLTAASLTVSTRGIVSSSVAGARLRIGMGGITVAATGSLDRTNISVIKDEGAFDMSAGTTTTGTDRLFMTGVNASLKLGAGQTLYDLVAIRLASLGSNVSVTNECVNPDMLRLNGYTLTTVAGKVYKNGMLKSVLEGSVMDPNKPDEFWLDRWYRSNKGV